jgi:hypothetical protein
MRAHFQKLRSNLELNDTFKDVIETRHAAVRNVIENNLLSIRDTKLIGSLQRQTRIQPRPSDVFDIDILVILGEFTHWVPTGGITPAQALDTVYSSVRESDRYSTKDPRQDAPTINLDFADRVKVELVPAYIDNVATTPSGEPVPPKGRGYWVAKHGGWEHADYDFEADYISQENTASDGWLIPCIKMLKAIRRDFFPALRSFPLEVVAAEIIPVVVAVRKSRGEHISSSDILESFFLVAKDTLATSLRIPGSNSPAVVLDMATVQSVKGTFGTIGQHIRLTNQTTTDAAKIEGWKRLFGDAFPMRL